MSDRIMNSRTTRRRLAPSEKYEMFVSVLTGQATQREAAARWAGDRPTGGGGARLWGVGLGPRRCRGGVRGRARAGPPARQAGPRGPRIGLVHGAEAAVRRVWPAEGLARGGPPAGEPVPRAPWPDWLEG